MKGLFNTILGQIEAKESRKYITLYGFNGKALVSEIDKAWKTTRISKHVFNNVGRLSVSFHKFFLIDMIFTLETLLESKGLSISKRSLLKAIDALKELTDLRTVYKDNEMNSIINRSGISKFNITPTDWQSEYLDIFSDRVQRYSLSGHLLDAEPGTGKTIGSLVLMECLPIDTIIMVVPKNAISEVWENTLKTRYRKPEQYWASNQNVKPSIGYSKYIVHYEYLPSFLSFLQENGKNKFGRVGVVVDECLHPDTEVITPTGYKKITEITTDDLVLQYHPDRTNSWVNPSRIVTSPTNEIHHYRNRRWEQVVTPNHRMVYLDTHKGSTHPSNFELSERLSKDFTPNPKTRTIISGYLNNNQGDSKLTPLERLLIASQADGSLHYHSKVRGSIKIAFSFTKQRKIDRLLHILESTGYHWKEYPAKTYSPGHMTRYRFIVKIPIEDILFIKGIEDNPNNVKYFENWVDIRNKNIEWCRAFIDELMHWDGYVPKDPHMSYRYYSSVIEKNVDIVQMIAVNTGNIASKSIQIDHRCERFRDVYRLYIVPGQSITNSPVMTKKSVEVLDQATDFHCLTVPTGMFYVRYNGKVSVTGNCHNFNDERSLRTETLVEICKTYSDYSLWMSGTPLKAMGKETIPLLSSIDPIFDKDARDRYVAVFGMASDRALDILRNRIGIISHKVRKDSSVIGETKLLRYEARVSVPNGKEYTISSIRAKMTKYIEERTKYYKDNMSVYTKHFFDGIDYYRDLIKKDKGAIERLDYYLKTIERIRKDYDPVQMKEESIFCNSFEKKTIIPLLPKELKDNFRKAKSVYKYVKLTIMGECLGVVLGRERSKCNRDIALNLHNLTLKPIDNSPTLELNSLDEIINNANKKTILFTSFVEVVKEINNDLQTRGYYPAIVYGDTNKDLSNILSRYEKDDTVNPLIATFQSLSTAVPLIMANTIVMLNRPFRDYEYKQAIARAWRKGQTDDVVVIDIYLDTGKEDNISTRSKDIADEAAKIVAKIMGYDEQVLNDISNESISSEACSTCTPGSLFTNDNSSPPTEYHAIDTISKNPNITGAIRDSDRKHYYKTDRGISLKDITDLTSDDPIWDSDDGRLVLKDINSDNENPVSYHNGKNSFVAW